MIKLFKAIVANGWILLLLIIAFALRFIHLDNQSLWLDELHTMREADPSISWSVLYNYLKTSDQHPPLFFIIERSFFTIFGYSSYVARAVSAILGTLSVWAMYRLGNEILNKSLGYICATLTLVNFYNISYSQEARPYILAFLLVALSFTWFIKLVKNPSTKQAVIYALFTALLLYSHYYSLFAVTAQFILALIFIFQEEGPDRRLLFRSFVIAFIMIGIAYLPCLPLLSSIAQIKTFWIQPISIHFLQDIFYEYFGNNELLNPLLIILLSIFFVQVSLQYKDKIKIRNEPLLLAFTICFIWVAAVMLIPYLRSLLTVPMLYPRYTIVSLPAIILMLAYGIELFKAKLFKFLLTGIFATVSLINLFLVKNYYTEVSKSQFREMTAFVVKQNKANYPIINELTSWQQQYYLTKFNSKASVYTGVKEVLIDSILKSSKYATLNGFWIVGAHHDNKPAERKVKDLDTSFTMVAQKDFYDAWAMLFISKKQMRNDHYFFINYTDFIKGQGTILPGEKDIAIWNGTISSIPLQVKAGTYNITIAAKGTPAANVYPHLNVFVNGNKIGDYFVNADPNDKTFNFNTAKDVTLSVILQMDNDLQVPPNEDRNVFVQHVIIQK